MVVTLNKNNKSLAVKAATWTAVGFAIAQVLRLGGNLILTRLLAPEAFGLMSLVAVLMSGLAMFSDLGIGLSVIQSKKGHDSHFLNTAFTLQFVRGLFVAVATCILAYPFAQFYGYPILIPLLQVTSLNAIINGLISTKFWTSNRSLDLGRLTLIELLTQIIGLSVTVAWVSVSPGVWGLVAGGIAGSVTKVLCSHVCLAGLPNRFCWDSSSLREMIHFGRWIFVSTILTFLANQTDRLVFGKQISIEMLGIYANAVVIIGLPVQIILRMGSSVLFPLYSRHVNSGKPLREIFDRVRQPTVVAGGMSMVWLFGCGPSIVKILYDERYSDGGWMIQSLALGNWFQLLSAATGSAVLASGKPKAIAWCNLGKLIGLVLFIPIGFWIGDFQGALIGIVFSEAMKYLILAIGVRSCNLSVFRHDFTMTSYVVILGLFALGIASWMKHLDSGPAPILFVNAMVAVVPWLPFIYPIWKDLRTFRQDASE